MHFRCLNIVVLGFLHNFVLLCWQVFLLLVYFNAVSWEGVKFRGRACQRRDINANFVNFVGMIDILAFTFINFCKMFEKSPWRTSEICFQVQNRPFYLKLASSNANKRTIFKCQKTEKSMSVWQFIGRLTFCFFTPEFFYANAGILIVKL
jgi:hypothetical protein